jgi:uncharacterized membrane protein YeaQ/YmgE (transglycosylase-associated protein family)
MSLLLAIFIGGSIGVGVGFMLRHRNMDQLLINVILGVAGSILAVALFSLASLNDSSGDLGLISFRGILCAIVGALILLVPFQLIQSATSKRAANIEHAEEEGKDVDELDDANR